MTSTRKLMTVIALAGVVLASAACAQGISAAMSDHSKPVVRIAELEIDPAQLDAYKAALAEEVETSVRVEPGVLALNAVSIDDNPTHIRLLEVYASQAAYEAHLQSPHFVKYKTSTAAMVKSLRLIPTTPLKLCAKAAISISGAAHCM